MGRMSTSIDMVVAASGSSPSLYVPRIAREPATTTSPCSMIWQAARIAAPVGRDASAPHLEGFGALVLRQQTAQGRDLAHLHRVGVESGHHTAQPRHVPV